MKRSIESLLSKERLSSYKGVSCNSLDHKLHRYNYNIELSRLFYSGLHILEIAIRNTLYSAYSEYLKDEQWLLNFEEYDILQKREKDKIQSAINLLMKKSKPLEVGRIIAELNFGFWVNLYDRPYMDVHMKTIKSQFPNAKNKNRDIFAIKRMLNNIRFLRNRVFHYEPIWYWSNLRDYFCEVKSFIVWIDNDLLFESFKLSEKEFEELIDRQVGMLK